MVETSTEEVMVTAVGVLEWIQETQLYTKATKQGVPLERVAEPLRSLAVSVDEKLVAGDFAQKTKQMIKDGQTLISESPAVRSVFHKTAGALCSFFRPVALFIVSLASNILGLLRNFQERYPGLFQRVPFVARFFALICSALVFLIDAVHQRLPEQEPLQHPEEAVAAPVPEKKKSSGRPASLAKQH